MTDLELSICAKHPPPQWVTLREVRFGTGYSDSADQRLDIVSLNVYPSKKFFRVAYEVKRSRSDFKKELSNPDKRLIAEQHFNETWFVVSDTKIASTDEIPEGWGLMVLTNNGLKKTKLARQREPLPLPETFWLSALRTSIKDNSSPISYEGNMVSEPMLRKHIDQEVKKQVKPQLDKLESEKSKLHSLQAEHRNNQGALTELFRIGAHNGVHRTDYNSDFEYIERLLDIMVSRKLSNNIRRLVNTRNDLDELIKILGGK